MAQNREIVCIFYDHEGSCLKGRDGIFRKTCQTCNQYIARKGGAPARKDLRRHKMEKIKERDMRESLRDY